MNLRIRNFLQAAAVGCALMLAMAGCGHKGAKAELEKAEAAFDKADTAQAQTQPSAPTAAAPTPTPEATAQSTTVAQAAPPPVPARQMLGEALASYKTGDFEKAVTRLQLLRSAPTLTPEQRMAVQDSVAAVMGELYAMAAKGDSRAIAAVKQYEQMQTAPRQ